MSGRACQVLLALLLAGAAPAAAQDWVRGPTRPQALAALLPQTSRLQSAKGRLRHLLPSESRQSHPSRFKAIRVASKHWQLARAFTPAGPGTCVQHARRRGFPEKNARHNATCNWP